jgi:Ca2+-binding RTX toxin-like protein
MATITGAEFQAIVETYILNEGVRDQLEVTLADFYSAISIDEDLDSGDSATIGLPFQDVTIYTNSATGQKLVLYFGSRSEYTLSDDAGFDFILDASGGGGNPLLVGNSRDNVMVGSDESEEGNPSQEFNGGAGNDTLIGAGGRDTLDGGTGDDVMYGGTGGDRYIVDSTGDVIVEYADEGDDDTVVINRSYTLADHFEHLELSGTEEINGTGNAADNKLSGNSAGNLLSGEDGNDTMFGNAGNDT